MMKFLKWTSITVASVIILFVATLPLATSIIHVPLLQIPYAIYLNSTDMTELEVHGSELHMNGVINSQTYDQFVKLLADNPKITTLIEQDVQGSIDDDTMIKLAYFVRKKGLNTKLLADSKIYSGGVDLFLAGVERTMENGAIIGVHSWSDGDKDAKDYPKNALEHEQNRKYIEVMLGEDDFYCPSLGLSPRL